MNETKNKRTGLFKTRVSMVKARPVIKSEEIIIDKNGEKFIGIYGDWRVWDENGYEYFMDRHSFKLKYQAWDNNALNLIHYKLPIIKKIK